MLLLLRLLLLLMLLLPLLHVRLLIIRPRPRLTHPLQTPVVSLENDMLLLRLLNKSVKLDTKQNTENTL